MFPIPRLQLRDGEQWRDPCTCCCLLQQYCVQTRAQLISKHVTLVMVQLSEVPALSRATIHTCNMPHMLSLQGCGEVWSANSTVLRCNQTLNYLSQERPAVCCLLFTLFISPLQGFGEVWSANNTILRCAELPSSDKRSTIIVSVISAVAGLALLSALLLVAQLYMRTQPKWLREHIMESKRKQGAPRCRTRGDKVHVSIVVTDVKDYTALTRAQPEAMNRAIGVHNNILRKVRALDV